MKRDESFHYPVFRRHLSYAGTLKNLNRSVNLGIPVGFLYVNEQYTDVAHLLLAPLIMVLRRERRENLD